VEVLLRVTNAAEMLMVLCGGLAGLLWNRSLEAGVGPRLAMARATAAFNLLLSAGLLLWSGCWRASGYGGVVLVLVLTTAVPRVLLMNNVRAHNLERSATENPVALVGGEPSGRRAEYTFCAVTLTA
jgi:hypothetical protein